MILFETLKNYAIRCNDYQDQNTAGDTTVYNQRMCRGWTWKVGVAASSINISPVFPITYDNDDITILVTSQGIISGSDPSTIQDLNSNAAVVTEVRGSTITTTGFTFYVFNRDAGNLSATLRYGFSWVAIGTKA